MLGPWAFVVDPWNTSRSQSTWPTWNPCLMGQSEWGRSDRVGSRGVRNLPGRVETAQQVFKSRGSGRLGSAAFQISRVGSSRVKTSSKSCGSGRVKSRHPKIVAGRVGSGHRVGSGDPILPDPTRPVRVDLTREKPCKKCPTAHAISTILNVVNVARHYLVMERYFPDT